ncbi:MAG: putative Ig domain-containing protein [Bacteroidota bacterium]
MKKYLLLTGIFILTLTAQERTFLSPKSDVFLQGFYWNSTPGGTWYDSLASLAPRLASAGFGGIWFPSPAKGAGGGFSMGYDPYDHYDFGEYNQKGSVETRFGSRTELVNAISTFHAAGIEVYADAVLRHMMGGEQKTAYECIPTNGGVPIVPDSAYLLFSYPNGSGRFLKTPAEFYPNAQNCFVDGRFIATDPIFRFGEWIDHNKQSVRDSLIQWGLYLRNVLKFDGFRLDAVKTIDPAFMAAFLKGSNGSGYAVAELWSSTADIGDWLNVVKNVNGASVAMFDFPLRYTLKEMCNNTGGGFDMRNLDNAGLAGAGISGFDYSTFVENHDFDRTGYDGSTDNGHDPVLSDKQLAYAYILFSEGRPCVFYKDYFNYGFAGAIDTLIWIRQNFLYGGTTKRNGLNPFYVGGSGTQDEMAQDIYVARRNGGDGKPAAYLVINDHPSEWRGVWVNTDYPDMYFKDYSRHDIANNIKKAAGDGRIDLWAPPRSYVVFVPDTMQSLNHPPVLTKRVTKEPIIFFTGTPVYTKIEASDANGDPITFSVTGNPAWLQLVNNVLTGTPSSADTGAAQLVVKAADPLGAFDTDTIHISVMRNRSPVLTSLSDTTVKATKRFARLAAVTDADGDSVKFSFTMKPTWLSVGTFTGLISGTPTLADTGIFSVSILATDGKGGIDSATFTVTVLPLKDSVISTYAKPHIDGIVQWENDWLSKWMVSTDNDSDSYWWTIVNDSVKSVNNELYSLYVTWDADSLYLGVDYYINDKNNTLILYLDALRNTGITNFLSTAGYTGDHPKNNRFLTHNGIDLFVAAYFLEHPSVYRVQGNSSVDISPLTSRFRGPNARGMEAAIGWNDIYQLGNGVVEKNAVINLVALAAGGFDYGSGDAMPDNPDVNGNAGPDSLKNLAVVVIDKNGDGIPDPTVVLVGVDQPDKGAVVPTSFTLYQNFPNPFNPATVISYQLPVNSFTTITVYDLIGRKVATLINEAQPAGNHSVRFSGDRLSGGVYFYVMSSGTFTDVKKLLLLK